MKQFRIWLLLMCFALFAVPVHAQNELTDEELELIAEVQTAFERLFTFDSVRAVNIEAIEQTIRFAGQTTEQYILLEIDSWLEFIDGELISFDSIYTQIMDEDDIEVGTVSARIISAKGELFVTGIEESGIFTGAFPPDWVNVADDPNRANYAGFILEDARRYFGTPILDENTILEAYIDAPTSADWEEMGVVRSIYITFSEEAFIESDFMNDFVMGFVSAMDGVDEARLRETMAEDAVWQMVVYFDADGELISHLMAVTLVADIGPLIGVDSFVFDQFFYQQTEYSGYNAIDFVIEPPID